MEPFTSECFSPSACPNSCSATRNRFWPANKQQTLCETNHKWPWYVTTSEWILNSNKQHCKPSSQ
jgi:hypothetical protein